MLNRNRKVVHNIFDLTILQWFPTCESGPTQYVHFKLNVHLTPWTGWSARPLTCCGHRNNFTPAAGPADVHCSHTDEVAASRLQLDQTLAGGHCYYRPEGLTNETHNGGNFSDCHISCPTVNGVFCFLTKVSFQRIKFSLLCAQKHKLLGTKRSTVLRFDHMKNEAQPECDDLTVLQELRLIIDFF